MPTVGRTGAGGVYSMGSPNDDHNSSWDLTSPGTWSNIWFFLSILVLAFIFLSL